MPTLRRSSVVAVIVFALTFGLPSFVPSAFGCSPGQGGASCRTVTSPIVWLDELRVLVGAIDALLP